MAVTSEVASDVDDPAHVELDFDHLNASLHVGYIITACCNKNMAEAMRMAVYIMLRSVVTLIGL
jgi:hypothetical protein